MNRLKTITTQYIDGNPLGIRVCLRTLSPITTLVIPRPLLSDAKKLHDLPTHGIYYLINDEDGALSRLYVGQTTQGILRLSDHDAKKEFWNKAILFLASDSVFTLDLISALERFGIEKTQASKRYAMDNKVLPQYRIDQYQRPIVEEVFEEIEFMMASLGYDLGAAGESVEHDKLLYTHRRGIKATGVYTGDKFIVLEGSPISMDVEAHQEKLNLMRQELIESGDLARGSDGSWHLNKAIEFGSPSAAAVFVLGGSANGWIEWADSEGRTMDALYRR